MRRLRIDPPTANGAVMVSDRTDGGLVAVFTLRSDAERFVLAVALDEFRASLEEDMMRGKFDE
jgi:hypothetical protein